mmetsp:Transcript_25181/g.41633  ORF Transcript_25181/g.41633 Transcript_25181/m.41633 type:complete len:323 (+) Transcript_25181:784-1752(+)
MTPDHMSSRRVPIGGRARVGASSVITCSRRRTVTATRAAWAAASTSGKRCTSSPPTASSTSPVSSRPPLSCSSGGKTARRRTSKSCRRPSGQWSSKRRHHSRGRPMPARTLASSTVASCAPSDRGASAASAAAALEPGQPVSHLPVAGRAGAVGGGVALPVPYTGVGAAPDQRPCQRQVARLGGQVQRGRAAGGGARVGVGPAGQQHGHQRPQVVQAAVVEQRVPRRVRTVQLLRHPLLLGGQLHELPHHAHHQRVQHRLQLGVPHRRQPLVVQQLQLPAAPAAAPAALWREAVLCGGLRCGNGQTATSSPSAREAGVAGGH